LTQLLRSSNPTDSGAKFLVDPVILNQRLSNPSVHAFGATSTVLTGSFNFTKAAEQQNAENLVTIRDSALAEQYTANWQKHLEHSEPYGVGTSATTSSAQRLATAEAPPPTRQGWVRGNKHCHIYQWPGCSSYDKISVRNRVEFPSAQAAEAAGYRPAHNCP
jgi:phosphatidylserine/phosphatidylglycerophosphate/cardiolipin synthase-like enzyme